VSGRLVQRHGSRYRYRRGVLKGRDFAAWLRLVPEQISTGDRTILGKISKRSNRHLRVLFVQAAWVVLINPIAGGAMSSRPGSMQPKSDCIAMFL
jgi:transposase